MVATLLGFGVWAAWRAITNKQSQQKLAKRYPSLSPAQVVAAWENDASGEDYIKNEWNQEYFARAGIPIPVEEKV